MSNEFGGIGFAPGVVRGTRTFKVDKLGRLLGVSFDQIWTPGENLAICRAKEASQRNKLFFGYNMKFFSNDPVANEELVENFLGLKHPAIDKAMTELKAKREEALLRDDMEACTHGFYGYYEGSNDFGDPGGGTVNGVIEGYGETVIGTRGFRAMKARIVALHIPYGVIHSDLVRRNYKDIPTFGSFEDMVREFPGDSAGIGISPENDPDFWTRSI